MRVKKETGQKLNNKGLSLVEVLVAMLILSVVSIVFLRSFSQSAIMNRDAKVKQYALTLAQSLMESVKAYDRITLDQQFGSGVDNDNFKIFQLENGDGSTRALTQSGENRVYQLNNVTLSNNQYDAKITITATTKTAQLLTVEPVNKYNDAFFKQDNDEQVGLYSTIALELANLGDITGVLDANEIDLDGRQINVTIASDDTVTVDVAYSYEVNDYTIIKSDLTTEEVDITSSTNPYSVSYSCYDNSATKSNGAKLEKLYLYYYPAYKTSGYGWLPCDSDAISIVNNSTTLKDIYILKQKNTTISDTNTAIGENTYAMAVSCNNTSGTADLNVYHNLGTKLEGAGSGSYSFSGASATERGTPWVEDTDSTVLVFDVKVEVMKHGSTEVLCELTGTTNVK
ncbi:MAG: prepilin-type N-terminal cleavage/methylation domain-containing protein [Lachnospiraceae bacterium]|nr:prepilin-type N-terminal cleavage/methylation domain-containing protein [Lachnospiraceae bacterium]